MVERREFKDGEKLQLALFCNAKEEILLNRKLRILESMKKQAETSFTLDQRILYNRFSLKLRRSEAAHAKLHGNRDLAKQLSQSLFPNLHTVVTDGSKKAVRVILQNEEASRTVSAPCRIQTHLAAVSVAKNQSCQDLQGKEAEIKDPQSYLGAIKEIDAQRGYRRKDVSAAKKVSICKRQTDLSEPIGILGYKRPFTAYPQKHDRLSDVNYRYQGILERTYSQLQHPQAEATDPNMSLCPEGLVNKGLKEGFLEQKKSSKGERNKKWRPNSRNLFLGLDNTPQGRYSSMGNHVMVDNHGSFNNKVKLFVQKIAALKKEADSTLQDYYSERLVENLGSQVKQDFLWDTQQEQAKWNPVGPETNHRSITIKNLDRDFMRKESPLEILIWEYYNEIITKENLIERKWLNNNPYQLIVN
ncbi:Hypothetical predicted protein [Podarcis lilfordi]|uniref:Uncharacterized protein n=1 Tax=Podarcis lilfordi TaxID=74358 RepID=A0AA35P225_9SAUR|nr:Hypothetical predicted protein [Podarcis lilfordi]